MKNYNYKINGNNYNVSVGDIENGIAQVEVNGIPYKVELEQKSNLMKELQLLFDPTIKAEIEVLGEVYPGTTIVIGNVSMMIQTSYKYCRFEKREGEVKMMPL